MAERPHDGPRDEQGRALTEHKVHNGNHALRVGQALGTLVKAGLQVEPEYVEGTHDYGASLRVFIPSDALEDCHVRLVVEEL
jgi:hypothetical protein